MKSTYHIVDAGIIAFCWRVLLSGNHFVVQIRPQYDEDRCAFLDVETGEARWRVREKREGKKTHKPPRSPGPLRSCTTSLPTFCVATLIERLSVPLNGRRALRNYSQAFGNGGCMADASDASLQYKAWFLFASVYPWHAMNPVQPIG